MVTGLYTVEILLSKLYEASESLQKNVDEGSELSRNSGDQFPYTTRIYRKYIWTKQSQLDVGVKITAFPNFTQNREGRSRAINTSSIKFSATIGRNNASKVHIYWSTLSTFCRYCVLREKMMISLRSRYPQVLVTSHRIIHKRRDFMGCDMFENRFRMLPLILQLVSIMNGRRTLAYFKLSKNLRPYTGCFVMKYTLLKSLLSAEVSASLTSAVTNSFFFSHGAYSVELPEISQSIGTRMGGVRYHSQR